MPEPVVEELLRPYLPDIHCYEDLTNFSMPSVNKVQLQNCGLILNQTILYTMLFIRAEREGDWPLHLHAVAMTIPYFFAAGHQNYARYGTYHLHNMRKLPPVILEKVSSR